MNKSRSVALALASSLALTTACTRSVTEPERRPNTPAARDAGGVFVGGAGYDVQGSPVVAEADTSHRGAYLGAGF